MRVKQLLWRSGLAILGGAVAAVAFPTEGIWFLTPLIPALMILSVMGVGFWAGSALGFLAGFVFYVAHIEWIALYLGPVPLIALATLQSLYFIPAFGLTALIWQKLGKSQVGKIVFALAAASIWVSREWFANNFPYGGFPWSRLAMTQADSFMSAWVFWGGLSALSFALALIGALLAVLARELKRPRPAAVATSGILIAGLLAVPLLTPVGSTVNEGSVVIAAVQGNANAGLFANPERGAILRNHLEATQLALESPLADQIDLIVWPENASDIDPLRSPTARGLIQDLVDRSGAPITFGTITQRGDNTYNSTLLWKQQGPVDYYDKKRPVPFAEYVPDREFWRMLAPTLIDMVPRGYAFGVRDGIFELGNYSAGTLICFEIAIDSISRDLVSGGANIILSQTNNADFGYSDETYQQVAIARLRAIETGRTVVNISTVGKSAIYGPDGALISQLPWYEPGAMVERVPLQSGLTPAMRMGGWFDFFNILAAAGLVIYASLLKTRSGRGTRKLAGRSTK